MASISMNENKDDKTCLSRHNIVYIYIISYIYINSYTHTGGQSRGAFLMLKKAYTLISIEDTI